MKTLTRCFFVSLFSLIVGGVFPVCVLAVPTIKKLVGEAKPGQTVKIPSGVFIEDVVVPPGVSIAGRSARKTIIVGSLELTSTPRHPVTLSHVKVIHTGGRSSSAVSCGGGDLKVHNSFITSEGGFAAITAGNCETQIYNNIIVGPRGDYAMFGRGGANLYIVNNTIVVQGFGLGLMDQSYATIRNCLFYGDAKPGIIRTNSDYSITYSNISLSGGSFFSNHDLINDDVKLRDNYSPGNNPTAPDITNKDFSKYDSIGLTFISQDFLKYRSVNEYRKNQPSFAFRAGSSEKTDNNADGSRNNLGAFGGPLGNRWR